VREHRRIGELEGSADDGWVWMACDYGADIRQLVEPAESGLDD
jgi:hypothetical protein